MPYAVAKSAGSSQHALEPLLAASGHWWTLARRPGLRAVASPRHGCVEAAAERRRDGACTHRRAGRPGLHAPSRGVKSVINIVHLPRAAMRPDGDVVSCDVAREDVSAILSELRELGLEERGSIALDTVDTSISAAAQAAERHAAGSPADAVVWEEVETRTSESAELSGSFLAFMMLTVIAAIGILTDSIILIIGAMVVGPEGLLALAPRRPRPAPCRPRAPLRPGTRGGLHARHRRRIRHDPAAPRSRPRPRRAERREPPRDPLHLDQDLLGARCPGRGRGRDAVAHHREVRRARGRPDLGDHDPGPRPTSASRRPTRTGTSSPGRARN